MLDTIQSTLPRPVRHPPELGVCRCADKERGAKGASRVMGRQSGGSSSGQEDEKVQGDECDGALRNVRALRAEQQQGLPQARAARLALVREAGAVAVRLQKAPPSLEAANTLETARSQVTLPCSPHLHPSEGLCCSVPSTPLSW